MKHIVIDVESLSIRTRPVITQFAAVIMVEEGIVPHREFECTISIDAQLREGSSIDQDTLLWWAKQERKIFIETLSGATTPALFCRDLREWWNNNIRHEEDVLVWASDPLLDFGGTVRLHEALGYPMPWTHRQQRDARTLRWLVDQRRRDEFGLETDSGLPPSSKVTPDRPHNALSDALALSKEIWSNLRALGVRL